MKKNNKIIRFAIYILMITLLALVLVASTYAKYSSEVAGSDTATVAKWSFKVGGVDIAKRTETTDLTFDLFDTITNTDGSTETGVKATDGSLIAPGTMGSFKISVENASEVLANYSVKYTVTNADSIPLLYSTDKSNWSSSIDSVDQSATEIAVGGKADTVTVYWKWDFEKMKADKTDEVDTDNDAKDTALAIKDVLPTVKITAKITAEQKDSK